MGFCPKCGRKIEINLDWDFCPNCGAKIDKNWFSDNESENNSEQVLELSEETANSEIPSGDSLELRETDDSSSKEENDLISEIEEEYCSFCGATLVPGWSYCKMCGRGTEEQPEKITENEDLQYTEDSGEIGKTDGIEEGFSDQTYDNGLLKKEKRYRHSIIIVVIIAILVVAGVITVFIVTRNQNTVNNSSAIVENKNENPTDQELSDVQVGDLVKFGEYESDDNTLNGREALNWKVLAVKDGQALLITENVIDAMAFGSSTDTWKTSSLRQWLNDTFMNQAFSEDEKKSIVSTTVRTKDNPSYGTDSGKKCTDKVFLLSGEEAAKYFESEPSRKAKGSTFAEENDLFVSITGSCRWWLRNAGSNEGFASVINGEGVIDYFGAPVDENRYGVRPVMWINASVLS